MAVSRNSQLPRSTCDGRGRILLTVMLAVLVPAMAFAKKPPAHCRDFEFTGAAGAGSQDVTTFKVVDSLGIRLDQSCTMRVEQNESGIHFASRVPLEWGTSAGGTCLSVPPTPVPNKSSPKSCATLPDQSYSCTHQFVFKKSKTAGADPAKKYIRICCFEGPNCTKRPAFGKSTQAKCQAPVAKVGMSCTTDPNCDTSPSSGDGRCGQRPMTVQAKVQGKFDFTPSQVCTAVAPPSEGCIPFSGGISLVAIDPIGMVQRPPETQQSCRGALRSAEKSLVVAGLKALRKCYFNMMTDPAFAVDCSAIDTNNPFFKNVQDAIAALNKVAGNTCASQGSPQRLGYKTCPAPCDSSIAITDWPSVASCLSCVAQTAATTAINDKYSGAGTLSAANSPDPNDVKCQDKIGDMLTALVSGELAETFSCQSNVDGGTKSAVEHGVCLSPDPKACVTDAACDTVQASADGICDTDVTHTCVSDNDKIGARCSTDAACDMIRGSADGRCRPDGVCITGKQPCVVDVDCDSAAGSGDGRCGTDGFCRAGKGQCLSDHDCDSHHGNNDGLCDIGGTGLCTAGNISQACQTGPECDTDPSSDDGICSAGPCKNTVGNRPKLEKVAAAGIKRGCVKDLGAGPFDFVQDFGPCNGLGFDSESAAECVVKNARSVANQVADGVIPEGIDH